MSRRDLKATILICMFQRNHNYSQNCNQSRVSISTDVFEVKVYLYHMIKTIMLCITAQLK